MRRTKRYQVHRDRPENPTLFKKKKKLSLSIPFKTSLFPSSPSKRSKDRIAEMMSSVPFPSSSSSSFLLEAPELSRSRASSTICNSSHRTSASYIPKLEPFSRSKIEREVKGPSFIQKTENYLGGITDFVLFLMPVNKLMMYTKWCD
ncbi:CCG-binding protein 1-like protein [Cinnamomum micranthum f. kanehirae]|uniref:CCG-binding protein 1-like protein n=1 Tax=Cinnamomum micranthum f. kanehirae TaxID=337451 RepID=A0A3S3NR70_9MAGN|nr:CCG-binding protein 1-like protein [Cinnamomum micranthum f. kanehirae]